jgi:tripeptidyl-peptidase-1
MFALKQQNLAALESKFWSVSNPKSAEYKHFLSIDEISSMIAPKAGDVAAVTHWLLLHGITDIISFSDALEVFTTVGVAERLFQTEFFEFQHEEWSKVVVRQFGSYSLPDAVSQSIDLITGLANFPAPYHGAHPLHVAPRPNPSHLRRPDADLGVVAQTVYSLYNIGPQKFGNATSITSQGVIEFEEQTFSPEDLVQYASLSGIQITPLTKDHIVGTNADYGAIEATLDIQFISTVNTEATNWFWIEDGTAWLYGFTTHFFNTTTVPLVISISYGWWEGDQCYIDPDVCQQLGVTDDAYVARVNVEFQKVALRGISILVSSGDSGAHTRTDETCTAKTLRAEFPSSSPYVTSVGATQITNPVALATQPKICTQYGTSCAATGTEVAVSFQVAFFTSGGGFSEVADQPSYQTTAVKNYLNSGVTLPPATYYNASRRGAPDVSAVGHNNLIYASGIEAVGGTSASAPIWAGIASLLNQASIAKSGAPLGFLNPLLYQIAADQPTAFNDITSGDNICTESGCAAACKGWYATKGWDPVTGLGTPNYGALLAYIQSH